MTTSQPEHSKAAIGLGATDLVIVYVDTKDGAKYEFPNMGLSVLKNVIPPSGRVPRDQPSLILMNFSTSVLMVPFNIIEKISVFGNKREVLWESTVSTAEEK